MATVSRTPPPTRLDLLAILRHVHISLHSMVLDGHYMVASRRLPFARQRSASCEQGRQLPEAEALALLRRSSQSALWRYLRHLISLPARGNDDKLHTELAMVLIDEAQDLMRLTDFQHVEPGQNGVADQRSSPPAPSRERSADQQPSGLGPSLGAHGRGGDAGEPQLVRRQLQEHLASSGSYDVGTLLERLAGTHLYEERVIVHAKARTLTLHPTPGPQNSPISVKTTSALCTL